MPPRPISRPSAGNETPNAMIDLGTIVSMINHVTNPLTINSCIKQNKKRNDSTRLSGLLTPNLASE
jgi:hypothetical protein